MTFRIFFTSYNILSKYLIILRLHKEFFALVMKVFHLSLFIILFVYPVFPMQNDGIHKSSRFRIKQLIAIHSWIMFLNIAADSSALFLPISFHSLRYSLFTKLPFFSMLYPAPFFNCDSSFSTFWRLERIIDWWTELYTFVRVTKMSAKIVGTLGRFRSFSVMIHPSPRYNCEL